jgi:hypothetical protein
VCEPEIYRGIAMRSTHRKLVIDLVIVLISNEGTERATSRTISHVAQSWLETKTVSLHVLKEEPCRQ